MLQLSIANTQQVIEEHDTAAGSIAGGEPPGGGNNDMIVHYWNRRPELNKAEWIDFYRRVVRLLMRTRLPEEYNDEAQRRDLVNCFFQDKILLNAETSQAGPLQYVHALHGYLKNYEIDVRRAMLKRPAWDGGKGEDGDSADGAEGAEGEHAPAEPGQHDRHGQLLAEAGIDVRAAMQSADRFIAALPAGEAAYLQHHSCTDEKPEPVSRIAQRMALGATFHIRAKQLGITRSKGETYRGYEATRIGAWLRSTGAQLNPEWREELAALLVLLCQQVRLHVQGRQR